MPLSRVGYLSDTDTAQICGVHSVRHIFVVSYRSLLGHVSNALACNGGHGPTYIFNGCHYGFGLVVVWLVTVMKRLRGVSSVALEGDNKDKLTVTGDVDAVHLGRVLRKKFQCVTLVSVEEVKKKDDNKCKIEIEDDKGCYYYTPYCAPPPCGPSPYCHPVYDSYDSTCSIM
ncbi:hypothetical protein JHK85_018489 [Glycine max]|nr:hypothetical protein JHK85_018489 [Glycine max]KAG5037249.1 hypothetical protein JHK86_018089 [Glycine max]